METDSSDGGLELLLLELSQGHCGERREKGIQREGSAVMNNSPLCALLLLLIFAYAQGNDSAVQLRAPPSADLHSTPLNQASIL